MHNIEQLRRAALDASIEETYNVFAGHQYVTIAGDPFFPPTDCLMCQLAKPPREVPVESLKHYYWKAMTTWGTQEDFRHFLPRLLEILAFPHEDMTHASIEPDIVFMKLADAHWKGWPNEERAAISMFLSSLWLWLLSIPWRTAEFPYSAGRWLEIFALAVSDVSEFLMLWKRDIESGSNSLNATLHVAELVVSLTRFGKIVTGFTDEAIRNQINAWVAELPLCDYLEKVFFACDDPETSRWISEAELICRWSSLTGRLHHKSGS